MSGEQDMSQQQQQHQQATESTASSPGSGPSAHGSGSAAAAAGGGTMSAASSGSNGVPAGDATATGAGSVVVVTDSVVPSLMQVYESMTQSRLDGLGGGMSGSNLHQQQQHHQIQQHPHFVQQQQQQQQLYLAQPGVAANAHYSSNMQLHHQQQMQFGPEAGFQFSLPPVPDPTFLSAMNGSSSMGAAAAASGAHSSNPGQYSMPDDQLRKNAAAATEEGGAPRGATGDDANISSTESSSSVGGGGGRKTRKRSLPDSGSAKDDVSTTSSTKERGSNKSRRKGKGKDTDGRWSKRFSWPEELHRDFVAAIFDVGLKHSSPSTILEHMPKHEHINNERVKSHLQKYRINRAKSKQEFMSSYEASLERLKKKKHQDLGAIKVLSGAEVAGHLTYASTSKSSADRADTLAESGDSTIMGMAAQQQPHPASHGPTVQAVTSAGAGVPQEDVFIFPRLTQAEKRSPIGASVGYLMGLFFSLKHQLMVQREAQQQQHQLQQSVHLPTSLGGATDDPSHVAAVFHSFIGPPPASGPGAAATGTVAPPTSSSTAVAQTPSVIHIPSPNRPGSTTTAPAATASGMPPAAAVPSTRTNLEENNIMKREMQNQMVVQNKMRALKQQELSKYRSASVSSTTMHNNSVSGGTGPGSVEDMYREEQNYNTIPASTHQAAPLTMHFNKDHRLRSASDELSSMRMAPPPGSTAPMTSVAAHQQQQQQQQFHQEQQQQYQGAGENAGDDPGGGGSESASGNPLQVDDFWQHDVVDDQLFQFLMSDG